MALLRLARLDAERQKKVFEEFMTHCTLVKAIQMNLITQSIIE